MADYPSLEDYAKHLGAALAAERAKGKLAQMQTTFMDILRERGRDEKALSQGGFVGRYYPAETIMPSVKAEKLGAKYLHVVNGSVEGEDMARDVEINVEFGVDMSKLEDLVEAMKRVKPNPIRRDPDMLNIAGGTDLNEGLNAWIFESSRSRLYWSNNIKPNEVQGNIAVGTLGIDQDTNERWVASSVGINRLADFVSIQWRRLNSLMDTSQYLEPRPAPVLRTGREASGSYPHLRQWAFPSRGMRETWSNMLNQFNAMGAVALGTIGIDMDTAHHYKVTNLEHSVSGKVVLEWTEMAETPYPGEYMDPEPAPVLNTPATATERRLAQVRDLSRRQHSQPPSRLGVEGRALGFDEWAGNLDSLIPGQAVRESRPHLPLENPFRNWNLDERGRPTTPKAAKLAQAMPEPPENKDRLIVLDEDAV